MPTYDYECGACNHKFEVFQSMSAPHLRKCPQCGKRSLKRLIGTGAAVLFKGSGFYETDYRSESYKKAAKADKPDSTSSDSKNSKNSTAADSSQSKPAANTAEPSKKNKGTSVDSHSSSP